MVIMFQKRFVEPILSLTKFTTIRPRSDRYVFGRPYDLRYWADKAYRSPQIEFASVNLKSVTSIEVHPAHVDLFGLTLSIPAMDLLAKREGFNESADFFEWFSTNHKLPLVDAVLLEWTPTILIRVLDPS